MTIGIAELLDRHFHLLALAVHTARRDQNILGFRTIAARIHRQRTADSTRNTGIEFQPRNGSLGRGPGHHGIQSARTGCNGQAVSRHLPPCTTRQTDNHTGHTTIAHNNV